MLMKTYPLVQDAAFLLDEEVAAYCALASDRANNSIPEDIAALSPSEFARAARDGSLPKEYYDLDWLEGIEGHCYASSFDGEINTIFPEKAMTPIVGNYSDDLIHYILAARAPKLFEAAYISPEELIAEFKANASLVKLGLPEDFDWWRHLVAITGTTFG